MIHAIASFTLFSIEMYRGIRLGPSALEKIAHWDYDPPAGWYLKQQTLRAIKANPSR